MSETSDITKPLVAAIRAIPFCTAHRLHSGKVKVRGGWMQLEPEGTPDVLAILWPDGRTQEVVYFETKALDGKLNARQIAMHRHLRQSGFRVEVPRSLSEGLSVVRELLGERKAASE